MTDTSRVGTDVSAFLGRNAGTYLYTRFFFWATLFFFVTAVTSFVLMCFSYGSIAEASLRETIHAAIILVPGPYLAWSTLIVALKFKKLRIDASGIRIEPFGLRIPAENIIEIVDSENYAGAGTLKITLKKPRKLFHVVAWSWGATVTIAFNERILKRV